MSPIRRLTIVVASLSLLTLLACMANPHFVGGKNYVKQEVWDKAVTELKLATEEQPGNAEAWYYLGWAYGEEGDYGKAADAFHQCKSLSSAFDKDVNSKIDFFWDNLAARGQDLEQGGSYTEAAELFEDAIKLKPEHTASYQYIARIYGQMGEIDKAADKYEEALELQPDNDTTLTNYAKFLEDHGLEERAVPLYEKLSDRRPDDTNLKGYLANLYWGSGQKDKAIALYKELGDVSFFMSKAYESIEAERYAEAIEEYGIARQVAEPGSEDYLDAFYNSIVAAYKMEDYDTAIRLGEQLVEEDPKDPRNWRILGRAYSSVKRSENALSAYKKAEDLEKGR